MYDVYNSQVVNRSKLFKPCFGEVKHSENTPFFTLRLQVYYSTQSITKPKAKSNEDSLREIEEAMKKVKEAQSLVSATVDPLMGLLNKRSR